MPPVPRSNSGSGWWHNYYIDHPDKDKENNDAAKTGNSGKFKECCEACFNQHLEQLLQLSVQSTATGTALPFTPDLEDQKRHLWSLKAGSSEMAMGYRTSAAQTLVNHLALCPYQRDDVKQSAQNDTNCSLSGAPGRAIHRGHQSGSSSLLAPPTAFLGLQIPPSIAAASSSSQPRTPGPLLSLLPGFENILSCSFSPAPSVTPDDSISNISRNSSAGGSGILQPGTPLPTHPFLIWDAERQRRFERQLARVTASTGLPSSWLDNIDWRDFVKEFCVPGAIPPSQKVMTSRIIPKLIEELQAQSKKETQGLDATLQANGWTGENHRHLIAFMIMANQKVYTVKVDDVSTERKNAENLLVELEDAIKAVENDWGSKVAAIVTDASGECRKARRELVKKFPWIVVLDCFAHQVNLVVGDYFDSDAPVLEITDQAGDLITWLRSKKIVLALLRDAQERAKDNVLTILRAVLTHWTSHFRAYERLLEVQGHL